MVPEATDFETVDRIIFAELVDGVFTDGSQRGRRRHVEWPVFSSRQGEPTCVE